MLEKCALRKNKVCALIETKWKTKTKGENFMKNKIIYCLFSCFMVLFCCVIGLNNMNLNNHASEPEEKTRTVAEESLNWNNYYSALKADYEDVAVDFDEQDKIINLSATQVLSRSDFEAIENLSLADDFDEVTITYNMQYIPEENVLKLVAVTNGEVTDELIGSPFYDANGKLDAVFNCDGEAVYLSDLQEAGLINNCGWFKNLIKKVAKVVVAAVVVAAVVATVVVAAPAVAAAVTTVATATVTVGAGGAAALATTGAVLSAAGAAAATAAAAAAGTALACGAAAAAVVAGVGIAQIIVDEISGTMTLGDTYTIGKEGIDKNTISLIDKLLKIATFASLREMTRSYHGAFVVRSSFTENGKTYGVGELYRSSMALTFDEAYAVLIKSGLVNAVESLTGDKGIIDAVTKTVITQDLQNLIDLIARYKKNGYFGKQAMGVYADTAEAATTLAIVTGAWIKDTDARLYAYGGSGGYNHYHDIARIIHIWYGSKIA